MAATKLMLALLFITLKSTMQTKEQDEAQSHDDASTGGLSKKLNINVNVNLDGGVDESQPKIASDLPKETIQRLSLALLAKRLRDKLSQSANNLSDSVPEEESDKNRMEKILKEQRRKSLRKAKEKSKFKESYSNDVDDKDVDKIVPASLNENPHPPGAETDEEKYDQDEDVAIAPKMNEKDPFDNKRFKNRRHSFKEEPYSVGVVLSLTKDSRSSVVKEPKHRGSIIKYSDPSQDPYSEKHIDENDMTSDGASKSAARAILENLKQKNVQHSLVKALLDGVGSEKHRKFPNKSSEDFGAYTEPIKGRNVSDFEIKRHSAKIAPEKLVEREFDNNDSPDLNENENFKENLMTKVDTILSRVTNKSDAASVSSSTVDHSSESSVEISNSKVLRQDKRGEDKYHDGIGHINQQFLPMVDPEVEEMIENIKETERENQKANLVSINHIKEAKKLKEKQHSSNLFNDSVLSGEDDATNKQEGTKGSWAEQPKLHSFRGRLIPEQTKNESPYDIDAEDDLGDDSNDSADNADESGSGSTEDAVTFHDDALPGRLTRRDFIPEDSFYSIQVLPVANGRLIRSNIGFTNTETLQHVRGLLDYKDLSDLSQNVYKRDASGDTSGVESDDEDDSASNPYSNTYVGIKNPYDTFLYAYDKKTASRNKAEKYFRRVAEDANEGTTSGQEEGESGSGRSDLYNKGKVEEEGSGSLTGTRRSVDDPESSSGTPITRHHTRKTVSGLNKRTKTSQNKRTYVNDTYISTNRVLAAYILNRSPVAFDRRDSRLIPHPEVLQEPRSKVESKEELFSNEKGHSETQPSKKSRGSLSEDSPSGLLSEAKSSIDSKAYPRTIIVSGNVSMKDVLHDKTFGDLAKRTHAKISSSNTSSASTNEGAMLEGQEDKESSHSATKMTMVKSDFPEVTSVRNGTMSKSRNLEHEKHLSGTKRLFSSSDDDGDTPTDHINTYEVEQLYKHGSDASIHMMPLNRDITTPPGGFSNPEDDFYDMRGANLWTSLEETIPLPEGAGMMNGYSSKGDGDRTPFYFHSDIKPHHAENERAGMVEEGDGEGRRYRNDMEPYRSRGGNLDGARLTDDRVHSNEEAEEQPENRDLSNSRFRENEGEFDSEREGVEDARRNGEHVFTSNSDKRFNYPSYSNFRSHHTQEQVAGGDSMEVDRGHVLLNRQSLDFESAIRSNKDENRLRNMEMASIEGELKSRSRTVENEHNPVTAEHAKDRALDRPRLRTLLQDMKSTSVAMPVDYSGPNSIAGQSDIKSQLFLESSKPITRSLDFSTAPHQEGSQQSPQAQLLSASGLSRSMTTLKRRHTSGEDSTSKHIKASHVIKRSVYDRTPERHYSSSAIKRKVEDDGYKRSLKATLQATVDAPNTIDDDLRKQPSEDDLFLSRRRSYILQTVTEGNSRSQVNGHVGRRRLIKGRLPTMKRNSVVPEKHLSDLGKLRAFAAKRRRHSTKRNSIVPEKQASDRNELRVVAIYPYKIYKRQFSRPSKENEENTDPRWNTVLAEMEVSSHFNTIKTRRNSFVHRGYDYDPLGPAHRV